MAGGPAARGTDSSDSPAQTTSVSTFGGHHAAGAQAALHARRGRPCAHRDHPRRARPRRGVRQRRGAGGQPGGDRRRGAGHRRGRLDDAVRLPVRRPRRRLPGQAPAEQRPGRHGRRAQGARRGDGRGPATRLRPARARGQLDDPADLHLLGPVHRPRPDRQHRPRLGDQRHHPARPHAAASPADVARDLQQPASARAQPRLASTATGRRSTRPRRPRRRDFYDGIKLKVGTAGDRGTRPTADQRRAAIPPDDDLQRDLPRVDKLGPDRRRAQRREPHHRPVPPRLPALPQRRRWTGSRPTSRPTTTASRSSSAPAS